jgi:rSAM/selenodomain-associated transferase 2
MRISIIIPALNEAAGIAACLLALRAEAPDCELVLADGGSRDLTREIARPLCDAIIESAPGRAAQMNAGAAIATGDILLFLHADTRLPARFVDSVAGAIASGSCWGRFDVRIDGRSQWLPVIARMMNLRSRLTSIATGDQAMFMTRGAFEALGGFPDQRLMEDIEMSRRLKGLGKPACLAGPAITSGRRWDEKGVFATVLLMWRLRFAYWAGADPEELAIRYGYGPGKGSPDG